MKNLWFGSDTFGTHIECAEREDGVFFWREYGFNGYAKAWSKWRALEEAPRFQTHGENKYTGEITEYDEPQLFWGFGRLTKCDPSDLPRYRLPKA